MAIETTLATRSNTSEDLQQALSNGLTAIGLSLSSLGGPMDLNLGGKTVVVTGAASGIGRTIALGFARQGARVFASDIDSANLLHIHTDVSQERIETRTCDVSKEQDVSALFGDPTLAGGLDVLVHCAGITFQRQLTETSTEEYRRLIEVNLSGTFFCLQQAVAHMKAHQRRGSIIVISSINAHRPLPSQAVYTCTKAAIESLVQSLAVEVAPDHIRVNCIAPGAVNTNLIREPRNEPRKQATDSRIQSVGDRIPYGRVGEPEDIVGTALFLASPLSEYMTGASLVVDGGLSLKR